ncbi:MAG: DUF2330 domain-containing protein [Candidatus Edwardsbacteria bacterium]|nr:DUF2330 domain-containing protein [Candidatus Edwardsbacteria bacterium]
MRVGTFLILTTVFALVFTVPAFADMGAIVPSGDVALSEPGQKAVVLFNGEEEVLILGTDIAASGDAVALRFIPFPAEPAVSAASPQAFEAAARLVKQRQLKYVLQYRGGSREAGAVEVVLRKRLPGHDITVVKVDDAAGFGAWVREYFARNTIEVRNDWARADSIAADYASRGISYFAFDLVDLKADSNYVSPVQYRFKTGKLYYPLKTSNSFGGEGQIDLILFAPCAWQFIRMGFQASTSAQLNVKSLKAIYNDSKKFFKGKDVILQAFRYQGALSFDDDIFADTLSGMKELKLYSPRR